MAISATVNCVAVYYDDIDETHPPGYFFSNIPNMTWSEVWPAIVSFTVFTLVFSFFIGAIMYTILGSFLNRPQKH